MVNSVPPFLTLCTNRCDAKLFCLTSAEEEAMMDLPGGLGTLPRHGDLQYAKTRQG